MGFFFVLYVVLKFVFVVAVWAMFGWPAGIIEFALCLTPCLIDPRDHMEWNVLFEIFSLLLGYMAVSADWGETTAVILVAVCVVGWIANVFFS
jgi:hypothetical protein